MRLVEGDRRVATGSTRHIFCNREMKPVRLFFFQAEAGIRDYKVTGVQTCALPIYRRIERQARRDDQRATLGDREGQQTMLLEILGREPLGQRARGGGAQVGGRAGRRRRWRGRDRKSVVEGKRVDLGGRRIIKKKKK